MAQQNELDGVYMATALAHASLSKARRAKVGACLVTSQGACLTGFNGTPKGLDNDCEQKVTVSWSDHGLRQVQWVTKPEVIHAELNCILKAAKEGISCMQGTVYVTLSPCVPCAAMLINAGISRLVYKDVYRSTEGLDLLKEAGIITEKYKGEEDD